MSAARSESTATPRPTGPRSRSAAGQRRTAKSTTRGTRTRRWVLIAFVALALAGGAALALRLGASSDPMTPATGTLEAERTSHDFGQVAMGGGLLLTRFPLAVEGDDALVTSILTS